MIAHLQAVGFTIEGIDSTVGGVGRRARWRTLAERKLADLDAHIERARRGEYSRPRWNVVAAIRRRAN